MLKMARVDEDLTGELARCTLNIYQIVMRLFHKISIFIMKKLFAFCKRFPWIEALAES